MSHKIALTGIGVINGSFKGTNRFNLKLYDGTFDGLLFGENNLDDLIESAVKDVRSDLFKDGFKETAIIQIADKISDIGPGFKSGFKTSYAAPDLLSALVKVSSLLDQDPIKAVIVISSGGAIVFRDFDLAVSEKDRIYTAMEKPISMDYNKMDEGDKQTIIPKDVGLLTICCDNPKEITTTDRKSVV